MFNPFAKKVLFAPQTNSPRLFIIAHALWTGSVADGVITVLLFPVLNDIAVPPVFRDVVFVVPFRLSMLAL